MNLLFDLDGTITDTNRLWLEIDLAFAQKRGVTVTQEYTDYVTNSLFEESAEFTREYYNLSETPQEIMAEWKRMAFTAYSKTCNEKPGAINFIKSCSATGHKLFIASAGMPDLSFSALKHFNIENLFTGFYYAQEIGIPKRETAFWIKLMNSINASPIECILYDDSPENCKAAASLGIRTIGITDPLYKNSEDILRRYCDAVIDVFPANCDINL